MGAEIFDVSIQFVSRDNGNDTTIDYTYASKLSFKKEKSTKSTETFNGTVTTGSRHSGATISLEGLIFPASVEEANKLEAALENDNIISFTASGKSYTQAGDVYTKTVTGSRLTISSDEEDWSPTDGGSAKLEFKADTFKRESH